MDHRGTTDRQEKRRRDLSRQPVWVVKLGGSLAGSPALGAWLDALVRAKGPARVVVPGGGPFADAVRAAQAAWRFDDHAAHRLAILAMRQYGIMLTALARGLGSAPLARLDVAVRRHRAVVWLPDDGLVDEPALPASWDVTSDSIAAWLAARLHADRLVLVKSAILPAAQEDPDRLAEKSLVDAAFPRFAAAFSGEVDLIQANDAAGFLRANAAR